MLPRALIQYGVQGDVVQPHYLLETDYPWLRMLIELYESYTGRRRRALRERLLEPLCPGIPTGKKRVASHVLDRLSSDRCKSCVPPKRARSLVFGAAARGGTAGEVIAGVAKSIGVKPDELRESLFADLPDERGILIRDVQSLEAFLDYLKMKKKFGGLDAPA